MTEPELIEVLHSRFNVDRAALRDVGQPWFAGKLFGELLKEEHAEALLLEIFCKSVPVDKELCEAAKLLIRHVKRWPKKSDALIMACARFMDYELELKPTIRRLGGGFSPCYY